jgi:hypothetical protein
MILQSAGVAYGAYEITTLWWKNYNFIYNYIFTSICFFYHRVENSYATPATPATLSHELSILGEFRH